MIDSFGAGGQMYMASIWGGENVRKETILPLFSFRATDNTHENAAQLTNLQEAQKVGSTMAFRANRLGFRVLWFGSAAPSLAEVEALKQLLASMVVTLTVGSNETKVAEFSGLDLMQPVDFAAAAAGASAGLNGGIGWINLQIPVEIQANVNIGGTIKFTRAIPSALQPAQDSDPAKCAIVVIMQGLKVVKS
jgi:hypothetical protein